MGHKNYVQGEYAPKNPEKYVGAKNPIYRSSYELQVFEFFDKAPAIKKWGAEVMRIPYLDPVRNCQRNYLVDIWVQFVDKKGELQTEIIEIKPYAQTRPPVKGRKSKKTMQDHTFTYLTNMAKWNAAKKLAESKGWKFRILTEKQIFG